MKEIVRVSFIVITLLFSSTLISQWVEQNNPSNKRLHGVNFLNTTTGFVCGDTGTVMISTNQGAAWSNLNTGIPNNINMTDIQFINSATGFCSGGVGSLSGKIYRTTNSGSNWVLVYDTTNTAIRDMFFINTSTGWAVGNTNVKYTSNGGANWSSRSFNGSSNTSVFAFSADTVFVTGFGSAGYFARSTNGGLNWSFSTVPGNLADLRFVSFANSFTAYTGGLALGGMGGMCKSTDRGLTWIQLNSYSGTTPLDGHFINESTGYVVNSSGELKLTTDGGASWSNQSVPAAGLFENIAVVNGFGIITGRKIATNITVGIIQVSSEVPSAFSLEQNYPNPFNPVTRFVFGVADPGTVRLTVFDAIGRQVQVLVDQRLSPGIYEAEFDGENFPSGAYYYRLEAGSFTETKKMILIK
jgi:photosystem II stability/assembly factor-like uncharacterized protein